VRRRRRVVHRSPRRCRSSAWDPCAARSSGRVPLAHPQEPACDTCPFGNCLSQCSAPGRRTLRAQRTQRPCEASPDSCAQRRTPQTRRQARGGPHERPAPPGAHASSPPQPHQRDLLGLPVLPRLRTDDDVRPVGVENQVAPAQVADLGLEAQHRPTGKAVGHTTLPSQVRELGEPLVRSVGVRAPILLQATRLGGLGEQLVRDEDLASARRKPLRTLELARAPSALGSEDSRSFAHWTSSAGPR